MPRSGGTWKKGDNVPKKNAGKPRRVSLVRLLKEQLGEDYDGRDYSYGKALIKKYLSKAIDEGDVALLRDAIDRTDGKPLQGMGYIDEDGDFHEQNLNVSFK